MKLLISCLFCGLLGMFLASVGITTSTPQFWVIIVTSSLIINVMLALVDNGRK